METEDRGKAHHFWVEVFADGCPVTVSRCSTLVPEAETERTQSMPSVEWKNTNTACRRRRGAYQRGLQGKGMITHDSAEKYR